MERTEMDVLMIRLNAYMGSGRYAEAREILDRVLEEEPSSGVAHGMLGWILWALVNDHERALIHFRHAVRWAPKEVNTWMHYLNLLAGDGLEDELREAYGRALEVAGIDRAQVHALLARYLERSGRRAAAGDVYRQAMDRALTSAEERAFRAEMLRLRGGGLRRNLAGMLGLL